MAPIGNLTKTGWLYEGNYEEWKERMDAMLKISGLIDLRSSTNMKPIIPRRKELAAKSASLIIQNISPGLSKRIPEATRSAPRLLVRYLEQLAQRFRLMDLSPELRQLLYQLAMPQGGNHSIMLQRGLDPVSGEHLLCVSRQIRHEALSTFWTNKVFYKPHYLAFDHVLREDIAPVIHGWVSTAVKCQTKHLRTVQIQIDDQCGVVDDCAITFRFSSQKGLTVELPPSMKAESRTSLERHVSSIEAARKALSLQGESIILAITSRPEIWKDGMLEFA